MTDLEKRIAQQVKTSLDKVIVSNLTGYNNPMGEMVKEVFKEERENVSSIMKNVLNEVISAPEFKETIKQEFNRKVAKFLVGQLEGQVKKATERLKQDPTFKSRMILAVENIVETELKELKN